MGCLRGVTSRTRAVKKAKAKKAPVAKKRKPAKVKKPVAKRAAKTRAPKPSKSAWPKLLHSFLHRTELVALGISQDGRHLATGSWVGEDYDAGGDLLVWEIATGRVVNHIGPISGGVGWPDYAGTIQWSPDGQWLAIAANTNAVEFFEPFAAENRPFDEVAATDGWSRPPSFCWAPDSKRIFISCWRSGYYDPRTNEPVDKATLPERDDVPGCIIERGVYEPTQWMTPGIPEGTWRGPPNANMENTLHIEPPRELRWGRHGLIGAGSHSQVLRIELAGRKLSWLETLVERAAIDPAGELVAVWRDGALELWSAETGRPLAWGRLDTGDAELAAIEWSHDGSRVALIEGGDDDDAARAVRVYAVDRANERAELLTRIEPGPQSRGMWPGDFNPFTFGPRGAHLAFLDVEGNLQVWNVEGEARHVATQPIDDVRGLAWGPSERLVAWSPTAIHFIDLGKAPLRVQTRALFDIPADDGPLSLERLKHLRTSQFPLGPKGARRWGASLDGALIIPRGLEADAADVLGWSDGRSSAPLDAHPIARFTSFAEAAKQPKALPLEVVEVLGTTAKSWGISEEPRELFDLYALLELDAAASKNEWERKGQYVALAQLYHRVKNDDAALRSLDNAGDAFESARMRLTLALRSAMRRELDRAKRYRDTVDATLMEDAIAQTPSLEPQLDALSGAVDTLLGGDGRARIDRAAANIEPEHNRGEKRVLVVQAYAAIGAVDRALEVVRPLRERAVPLLSDAPALGLDPFRKLADALSGDSSVLSAVVDGYLELARAAGSARHVFELARASLARFTGVYTGDERNRILRAQAAVDATAAFETIETLRADAGSRLELDLLAAELDPSRAKAWVLADLASAANDRSVNAACAALALVGEQARAAALVEGATDGAALAALLAALTAAPTSWPTLGPLALARAKKSENPDHHAWLSGLAFAAGDPAVAASERELAVSHLDLGQHGTVGSVGAHLAGAGDYEGAFAVLQRLPKAKRSFSIPQVAIAIAERLAKKSEPRGLAAVYSLLEALPTNTMGSGGRSYETSRVLRILEGWPRAWRDMPLS